MEKKYTPLRTYLRMFRKKRGLSQADVSALLGLDQTAISKHERGLRVPPLEVAFAYTVVYQVTVEELFPGLFESVELAIHKRRHDASGPCH